MLGGAKAVSQQGVQLALAAVFAHLPHSSSSCQELVFSACGQYVAARLMGHYSISDASQSWAAVAVLDVASAYQEQACFYSFKGMPTFYWATDPPAPHLTIADRHGQLWPDCRQGKLTLRQCPAVFVLDARTGGMLHALGAETESLLQEEFVRCNGHWGELLVSPCGQRLLVLTYGNPLHDAVLIRTVCANSLLVFDIVQNVLLARSDFDMDAIGSEDCAETAAIWHPNSQGLALSSTVTLHDPAALARGGLASGLLPPLCVLAAHSPGMGFCPGPDGQWLVAKAFSEETDSETAPPLTARRGGLLSILKSSAALSRGWL